MPLLLESELEPVPGFGLEVEGVVLELELELLPDEPGVELWRELLGLVL